MNRLNQILAIILAVQLAVAAFVLWPRAGASGGEATSLFPGLSTDQIVALTVTDAAGKTITLTKREAAWVLPQADDYPTLEDKVPDLLTKIVGFKADRLVAQTTASHKRLKVAADDYERLLEFELADGTTHKLYLGTAPSYNALHVRADDEAKVYLVSGLSTTDVGTEATVWVERAYLNIPQDQVVAVTLENANGRFELVKDGEAWTLNGLAAGETLDQSKVSSLVSRARYVTLLQPLGKTEEASYGLQTPSAVVTVQAHGDAGDKVYTLTVGTKDTASNTYVVKSSESAYYVKVSEYSVKDLVEKTRDGFLQVPPTPTPAAAPTPAATPTP